VTVPDDFSFYNERSTEASSEAVIAEVPTSIGSKATLLAELARRLRFPGYFGYNWDALEECLLDLNWISEPSVVIRHSELPSLHADELRTYVAILRRAAKHWSGNGTRELTVMFPTSAKKQVIALLVARQ
jgi:hypothetical protein